MSDVTIDLTPIVREIRGLQMQIDSGLSRVQVEVQGVDARLTSTHDELLTLRQHFLEFVEQAERTARVQRAETKLAALKDDLDRQFGHHNIVRRTSIGILQAFDVGNVSNTTVTQVSEELMIQTPRYWLAPALVTLAMWSKDDREVADISLAEAYRRDPRKTSLFLSLVLRRQGRLDASLRWLRQYFVGLDPMSLNREFVVVLECVTLGAFGPQGIALASERIDMWNAQVREDSDTVDAQVESWKKFLATHRQQVDSSQFLALRRLCPEWGQIEHLLSSASALPVAADWFESVRDRVQHRGDAASDVLDDILESLVTEYDADELPLRREILLNESLIEEFGDITLARERADALGATLDESIDVVSLQTAAAMSPDTLGVGAGTQQTAIGVGRDELVAGVSRYTFDYRARVMQDVTIDLNPTHTDHARAMGFGGWRVRTSVPDAEAVTGLALVWDSAVTAMRNQLMFTPRSMVKSIIIAVVCAFIVVLINPVAGLLAAATGAGIVTAMWRSKQRKAEEAIQRLESTKDEALAESVRIYRTAVAEYHDASQLYATLDAQEADLLQIISTWPMGLAQQGAAQ